MSDRRMVDFLAAFEAAIGDRTTTREVQEAHRDVFVHLPTLVEHPLSFTPVTQPACSYLEQCLAVVDQSGDRSAIAVGTALRNLAPLLKWHNAGGPGMPIPSTQTYAGTVVAGPRGLIASEQVEIGISIMAPHTVYPDHRHPPVEIYLVLSDGQWRQEDFDWATPGFGKLVYNPGNVLHSMRSGDEPLLSVWCLPLDTRNHVATNVPTQQIH